MVGPEREGLLVFLGWDDETGSIAISFEHSDFADAAAESFDEVDGRMRGDCHPWGSSPIYGRGLIWAGLRRRINHRGDFLVRLITVPPISQTIGSRLGRIKGALLPGGAFFLRR